MKNINVKTLRAIDNVVDYLLPDLQDYKNNRSKNHIWHDVRLLEDLSVNLKENYFCTYYATGNKKDAEKIRQDIENAGGEITGSEEQYFDSVEIEFRADDFTACELQSYFREENILLRSQSYTPEYTE